MPETVVQRHAPQTYKRFEIVGGFPICVPNARVVLTRGRRSNDAPEQLVYEIRAPRSAELMLRIWPEQLASVADVDVADTLDAVRL
jgi:hypothetical protein